MVVSLPLPLTKGTDCYMSFLRYLGFRNSVPHSFKAQLTKDGGLPTQIEGQLLPIGSHNVDLPQKIISTACRVAGVVILHYIRLRLGSSGNKGDY